jgi:hypothetical protein
VASGGIDVAHAIQHPPTQLPISIAQIAIGMPTASSPGNMRAAKEKILAINTTDATRAARKSLPKTGTSLTKSRRAFINRPYRSRTTG